MIMAGYLALSFLQWICWFLSLLHHHETTHCTVKESSILCCLGEFGPNRRVTTSSGLVIWGWKAHLGYGSLERTLLTLLDNWDIRWLCRYLMWFTILDVFAFLPWPPREISVPHWLHFTLVKSLSDSSKKSQTRDVLLRDILSQPKTKLLYFAKAEITMTNSVKLQ